MIDNNLLKSLPNVQIYLIAGPTGAGKTTIAYKLINFIDSIMLSMDNYFFDEELITFEYSDNYGKSRQWDSPSSIDFDLLIHNVKQLFTLNKTSIPQFCFEKNKRIGFKKTVKFKNQSIIIEGLYAIRCSEMLKDLGLSTFSIYLFSEENMRIDRIKKRDSTERNRPLSDFQRRFHFISLAEKKWITKQRKLADLIINT